VEDPVIVTRIVANIAAEELDAAHAFYTEILSLRVVMDHGWIRTFAGEGLAAPQISAANSGSVRERQLLTCRSK
jgi:catechol 2,3-dioxygenase-like lactoylglutathione lyase family enzyme